MAEKKYAIAPVVSDKMPRGIPYIIGNETAERFSFYGMRTILVVFMTKYLIDSDGSKDLMSDDQAKEYFHLFVMSAYFFPILGAILSDWLWGKYKTILTLSIVYCLGHLTLAMDETRLGLALGLTLIAVGSGGIKPCVSAHVGDQFGKKNVHLVSNVFSIFYFSINVGAFISTLLTPVLLKNYGPSIAFGVPGVLMMLATWVFWLGRNKFVHIPPGGSAVLKEASSGEGRRAILNLLLIYVLVSMFWSVFDQTGSAWVIQARRMDLHWMGIEWLPSQIGAINPIFILTFIPLFSIVIYPAINSFFPLTPLRKVSIGFFITTAAFALPAWIESEITGGEIIRPFMVEKENVGSTQTETEKNKLENKIKKSPSEPDSEEFAVENILDGKEDNTGWISSKRQEAEKKGDNFFPQDIAIRLRERKAWKISSVSVSPFVDAKKFIVAQYEKAEDNEGMTEATDEHVRNCMAKKFEVKVSATRVGPWKSVGTFDLKQSHETQTFDFPGGEVEAEFVLLRILDNWGGDYVTLGEFEVLSNAAKPPVGSHEYAARVWPNVAATGFRPSIVWQIFAYILLTGAEIMISITCLEFSYTQAPKKIKSLVMALFLASVALGNFITFMVNLLIQNEDMSSKLEGAAYYWFFTGLLLLAAIAFIFVAKFYKGKTYIQDDESEESSINIHTCPACGVKVAADASECHACGEALGLH